MKFFLRFLFALALLLGLGFVLTEESGSARFVWHGMVVETSATFVCIAIILLAVGINAVVRFLHTVRHGPAMWSAGRRLQQLHAGHNHLTAGLVAVAGGDVIEAGRRAVTARKNLGTTTLTQFVQAQAAQLSGDHSAAQGLFRALAEDPDSAVLGFRGLIMAARRQGNLVEMERLIDELRRLKGDLPWVQAISFDLAILENKWDVAGSLLAQPVLLRMLGADRARRARAALLIITAQDEVGQGDLRRALQAAEQAMKQAPDWIPAITTLAKIQIATGHRRTAQRIIEKHWVQSPHPLLAAFYVAEEKAPLDIFRALEKLYEANRDSAVSHSVMAAAALRADMWGEARRHLHILLNRGQATQGTYAMLAELAKRDRNSDVTPWLAEALKAPPDPIWLCTSCGGTHQEWQASCGHCNNFLTLEWQSPGVSRHTESDQALLKSYVSNEWISSL